jgi:exosome complex component RRP4
LKPGPGTYRTGGKVYASVLGLLSTRPPVVQVIPLSGRYIPKPHDVVLGTVTDVQSTFWLLDIGAPRWAPLHMTGTPWKIEVGETDQYLHVGDAVAVEVENLDPTGRIGVTMLGENLGKLEDGTIVHVSAARIPRVVGRGGSMVGLITRLTGAQIVVGQNGRIWVNGSPDAIRRVAAVLRLIDENGHRSGLTERVESFLLSTLPTTESGPASPGGEGPRRDRPGGPSGDPDPGSDSDLGGDDASDRGDLPDP